MPLYNRLKKSAFISAVVLLSSSHFAIAQTNFQFDGEITASCAFTSVDNGIIDLNPSNEELSSTDGVGTPATLHYAVNGGATVTIPALTFTSDAAGFTPSAATVQMQINDSDGNEVIPWTAGQIDHSLVGNNNSSMQIHARVQLNSGFPPGTYTLQTTATCAAGSV